MAGFSLVREAGRGSCVRQHSGYTRAFRGGHRATQIQQKKEELYDLIADAQAKSAASQRDRFVLKTLCTQVKPRPHDPQWREIITVKKASKRAAFAFVFVTGCITLGGLAQGARNEVEHEMCMPVEQRRI
ncbi:uncharacterized protein LOC123410148 [Hordeum vulgare subsp. vulgare]|uniref:Uncharacterized protein n=1 Tax=Hordeum vulgare subsp. vulgare TaxID=112509 RepID=M0V3G9_HORVV|nr:uncharacterized protein LOC123410148 [Hordeum vulgare subsp. vulgare]XP_044958987.1 uncharacterized protein LOC123410148 [Hordeum vulgare subsp. vulgare]